MFVRFVIAAAGLHILGTLGQPANSEMDCSLWPDDWVCTLIWAPVCGSDGVTYGNKCFFEGAQCGNPELTFVAEGECSGEKNDPDCRTVLCPPPQCNQEFWQTTTGECCPHCECDVACIEIYAPVCGNNGVTYDNECFFNIAKCKQEVQEIVSHGECPPLPKPNTPCSTPGAAAGDDCLKCKCGQDDLIWHCSIIDCWLPCPTEHQINVPGKCCNACDEEWSCACSEDGMSGHVQVHPVGCGKHIPNSPEYCYVRAPEYCSHATKSSQFPGAAWMVNLTCTTD